MSSPRTPQDALLRLIPGARREILVLLKRRGPLGAERVAEALGITVSGARQHLTGLEQDGVVTHRRLRDGPGRPRHLYELTATGERLFPRNDGALARELLGYLQDADPLLLDRLFVRRAQRRVREARLRLEGKGFEARVRELARFLEDEGYMPRVEPTGEGTFRLVARDCPVRDLGERYRGACAAEASFIRKVLTDADVRRVSHVLDEEPACAWEIRRKGAEQGVQAGVDEERRTAPEAHSSQGSTDP